MTTRMNHLADLLSGESIAHSRRYPLPWKIYGTLVRAANGSVITNAENPVVGALVAAAPQLFDALLKLTLEPGDPDYRAQARAALAEVLCARTPQPKQP